MKTRIIELIHARPKALIFIMVLLTIVSSLGVSKIEKEYDQKAWFRQGDPAIQTFEKFTKKYGTDTHLILLLDFKQNVFEKKRLNLLYNITNDLQNVKHVLSSQSLTSSMVTHTIEDEIITEPFIKDPQEEKWTTDYLNQKSIDTKAKDNFNNFLISADQQKVAIYANINTQPGREVEIAKEVINKVNSDLLPKYKSADLDIYLTGSAAAGNAFEKESIKDLSVIIPVAFILLTILFLSYFRGGCS